MSHITAADDPNPASQPQASQHPESQAVQFTSETRN